jgi:hypothetical protein
MLYKLNFLFIATIFLIVCLGCTNNNSRPADMPELVPCEIKILSDGQPLPDVEVAFHHSDPNFRWQPGATTNSNGVAKMVTYGQFFGVVKGDYTVTVTKTERETFDPAHPPKQVKVFTFTDPKLTDPKTSPLTINVSGKTTQSFEVGQTEKKVLRLEDAM